ncbi:MAG: gamma-glutamyl-gamma-aminobutyrate hydrolase family protein [Gemmatimonadetes bacterium]|nr:gamma-glutamyl-gamma-aminobutyrate hydrolase family protein [Gemmatimonadota bacterium]
MQSRPIIGVPTQNLQSLGGVAADIPPSWVMSQRYVQTLIHAGGLPWMIPLVAEDVETTRGMYEALDGIFLPGGADVDPLSYGEERHPKCDRSDPPRDRMEMQLVRWALEEQKPVLGVCRGAQIMNLVMGGTLWQDLAELREGSIKHDYFPFKGAYPRDYMAHPILVTDNNSRLSRIVGAPQVLVNSMHHQGIRDLAPGLIVTAVAPDGLIEAVESPDQEHFFVGVQWHPEVLTEGDAKSRRLFDEFIGAAGEYRTQRAVSSALA